MKYNHAFALGFEVISKHETGEDVSALTFRIAIMKRVMKLDEAELVEAIGMPMDTFEVDEK